MSNATYKLVDDGGDYNDEARCVACRESPADTDLFINDRRNGYVCQRCLKSLSRGGAAGWQRHLRREAKRLRLLADRMEKSAGAVDPDAAVVLELEITDIFLVGSFTALGRCEPAEMGAR